MPLPELQKLCQSARFSELKSVWREGSLSNGDADLCLIDRYFLLTQVLHRYDLLEHEWYFERCREVEAAPDGYLDLWFRGGGKSSIITFGGVIQEILRDPELTVGIFSHTSSIAKSSFLAPIKREFEHNNELKSLFPHIFYVNPQEQAPSWSIDGGIIVKRVGNPKEATVEAHGIVDGQPTSKHFKLIVNDDVVTEKSVGTPEQIFKTTEMWSLADNLSALDSRKWCTGTTYHYNDTYAEMIARGAVKVRRYPATHNGEPDGIPVLHSAKQWADKKLGMLESTVACQMLLNPLAGNQRMFNAADIGTYEVRPETLSCYIVCDPAHSMKKDSDHTAIIVVGVSSTWNYFILDGLAHRILLDDKWKYLRDLREKWLAEPGIQSVTVAYEKIGAQGDLQFFQKMMEIERDTFEIEEVGWPRSGGGSKIDRVQRLGPDIKSHRIWVPHFTDKKRYTSMQREALASGQSAFIARPIVRRDENGRIYDFTERLLQQVNDFPYTSKKDIVDALSRLYDLDLRIPMRYEQSDLEPAFDEL